MMKKVPFELSENRKYTTIYGKKFGSFICLYKNKGDFVNFVYFNSKTEETKHIDPYYIIAHDHTHTFNFETEKLECLIVAPVNDLTVKRYKIVDRLQTTIKNFNCRTWYCSAFDNVKMILPKNTKYYDFFDFLSKERSVDYIKQEIKNLENQLKRMKAKLKKMTK